MRPQLLDCRPSNHRQSSFTDSYPAINLLQEILVEEVFSKMDVGELVKVCDQSLELGDRLYLLVQEGALNEVLELQSQIKVQRLDYNSGTACLCILNERTRIQEVYRE